MAFSDILKKRGDVLSCLGIKNHHWQGNCTCILLYESSRNVFGWESKTSRDANHSDFCGIIPIFKANFRITISEVKIPANNDFTMVPDIIKEVTSTCTQIWRKS